MHKARRNTPLRSSVERGFTTMKRDDSDQQVRDISIARNRCHLNLMCVAINLRRALAVAE